MTPLSSLLVVTAALLLVTVSGIFRTCMYKRTIRNLERRAEDWRQLYNEATRNYEGMRDACKSWEETAGRFERVALEWKEIAEGRKQ